MPETEDKLLSEALDIIADELKAVTDILSFLCMTISSISPTHASSLKQTFENLSVQKEFPMTRSFSSLCNFLARALDRNDLDRPILSMKKEVQHSSTPEELRNLLHVIRGRKSKDDS